MTLPDIPFESEFAIYLAVALLNKELVKERLKKKKNDENVIAFWKSTMSNNNDALHVTIIESTTTTNSKPEVTIQIGLIFHNKRYVDCRLYGSDLMKYLERLGLDVASTCTSILANSFAQSLQQLTALTILEEEEEESSSNQKVIQLELYNPVIQESAPLSLHVTSQQASLNAAMWKLVSRLFERDETPQPTTTTTIDESMSDFISSLWTESSEEEKKKDQQNAAAAANVNANNTPSTAARPATSSAAKTNNTRFPNHPPQPRRKKKKLTYYSADS